MRKRTIEEVKEFVKENIEDVTLLSAQYEGARAPLRFVCNICKHPYKKRWNSIKSYKEGCPVCGRNGEKLSDEDIEKYVEDKKYEFLSIADKTTRKGTVLKVRCDRGHEYETTYRKFKAQEEHRGGSCIDCTREGYSRDRKVSSRKTREYARELGYSIKEEGHIKNHQEVLTFVCKMGHIRKTAFENIKNHPRCTECESRVLKHTPKSIAKRLREINIKLEYIGGFKNTAEPFQYKCECGNGTTGRIYDIEQGRRCRDCTRREFTLEDVIETFKSFECVLKEDRYENSKTEMRFVCACGNSCLKSFDGFRSSPMCKRCSRFNRRRGENHPEWNPEITEEERIARRKYPAYREWRASVFEKDDYTCQCCGDRTGGNLVAHHILNYSEHPELRVDIDNGITLCDIKCHKAFHDEYGYRRNNKEQLDEFINSKRKNNKEESH